MREVVYSKTETGQREIQTREMRLPPRLRSLLVQIDGKRPAAVLLDTLGAAGVTEAHFKQLEEAGLIASATAQPSIPETAPAPAPDGGSLSAEAGRIMALYQLCNGVIGSSLGLKGFMLQLQLEKLGGLNDYRQFAEVLVQAVRKARGDAEADSLQQRLAALLAG